MPATPIVLAVYGTLRRGERNETYLSGATFLGRATVRGRLHEVDGSALREYAYPALVPTDASAVVVELFELADPDALAAIDRLEAFDPADEAGSEYVRRRIAIVGGPVPSAWTYLYNGPAEQVGAVIADGDWAARGLIDRGGGPSPAADDNSCLDK